jgi:hypothetical protein
MFKSLMSTTRRENVREYTQQMTQQYWTQIEEKYLWEDREEWRRLCSQT